MALPEFEPRTIQTVAIRYTDYAIMEPSKISMECQSGRIEEEVAVADFELHLSGRTQGSNEELQV